MIDEYNELQSSLVRIRRFLEAGSKGRRTADQRIFDYVAGISATYSSYERFAEKAAFRFSEILLRRPESCSREQIENLKKLYVRNSSTLLAQKLGSGRYLDVTEVDVARSLRSCLDDAEESKLLLELIALHSSNLRLEPLANLFRWATPDFLARLAQADAVADWVEDDLGLPRGAAEGTISSELNDLVERRNEVSHRAIPDEILSYDTLLAKVDFLTTLSLGLVGSLGELVVAQHVKSGAATFVGASSEVYRQGRVFIVASSSSRVAVGDFLVAESGARMRWGQVLELQLDSQEVPEAVAGSEVGIRVDFAVPRRRVNLYRWPDAIPELQTPPAGLFGRRGPFEE